MFVVEIRTHHDVQKGQGKSTVAFRFYREANKGNYDISAAPLNSWL